jgi:hypothetical protein
VQSICDHVVTVTVAVRVVTSPVPAAPQRMEVSRHAGVSFWRTVYTPGARSPTLTGACNMLAKRVKLTHSPLATEHSS